MNSECAVQFRKWATGIIDSFTIKGYAMDDERLKNDGYRLGKVGGSSGRRAVFHAAQARL